ncbi:PEP/pyruvate-binding domain-containing protein [Aquisediminimonas sediminicola]|uniref:PEP/pyruvate-binding domain-containing protein n=1 Tax=Alteraquisediminimonas sediminicola TaxID=2676787 RepID=UPI001C8E8177|nr:PEP/pyruvate-binding domain-containing protein [Aquisediminimonas sediminicola]
MAYTLRFQDESAQRKDLVGGKGANLGTLTAAGLAVPNGFTITTAAYDGFIARNNLGNAIAALLAKVDFADLDLLDRQSDLIRDLIVGAPMPEDIDAEIVALYKAECAGGFVAVRSSGTAEDMEGASFAGLHDTYLDIRGDNAVLDAVRRCWASMWSSRAIAYRHSLGFDQTAISIAVVVQTMVAADASGVLFTANPLDARTDEIVINCSFGLGEAIVSGIITPDQITLDMNSLRIKQRVLGGKEKRIDRAEPPATGTVEIETTEEERACFALDDDQLMELGDLGRRIMQLYDGLPQDIEWAMANGRFYVLQARPVTGVDFLWEECLEEAAQDESAEEDGDIIWTNKWAEMYWTGGITPLFYAVRGRHYRKGLQYVLESAGLNELEKSRFMKYHRGTIYYNVDYHQQFMQLALPRYARGSVADLLPDSWVKETMNRPLDMGKYLRMLLHVNSSPRVSFFNWQDTCRDWIDNRVDEAQGLSDPELRRLSDGELKRYAKQLEQIQGEFSNVIWVGFVLPMPHIFSLLSMLVGKYYKGENKLVFQDLISGIPEQTLQSIELHEFHALADHIRNSPRLRAMFVENEGMAFFETAERDKEGQDFLEQYRIFVTRHGHRGHADRDAYYIRRAEDPTLDYEALRQIIANDKQTSPAEIEARVIAKREQATAEMLGYLSEAPFGSVLTTAFKILQNEALRFLRLRDDWRHFADRVTFSKRKAFREAGRRAVERKRMDQIDDCFFLSDIELYDVMEGHGSAQLARAKIKGRRKAFDQIDQRQAVLPVYLKGRKPVNLDTDPGDASGPVLGLGMSGGTAEGRARIVPNLREIGKIEKGDILICNATDPGWSSAFTLISGLVIETGGMLAHGACLSREHGIPAVQLRNAMQIIPDGARVRITGESGELVVLD